MTEDQQATVQTFDRLVDMMALLAEQIIALDKRLREIERLLNISHKKEE